MADRRDHLLLVEERANEFQRLVVDAQQIGIDLAAEAENENDALPGPTQNNLAPARLLGRIR
jgi:hypothetical protein